MACHVAEVMPFDSWSAPRTMVSRSCRSSVFTLTNPETAATMMTITVIESISFGPGRLGIRDVGLRNHRSAWRRPMTHGRRDAEKARCGKFGGMVLDVGCGKRKIEPG